MRLSAVLPHRAHHEETRAEALAKAQEEYVWDWSWPPGCATLHHLPVRDVYPPEIIARTAELSADLIRNHSAQAFSKEHLPVPPPLPRSSKDLVEGLFAVAEQLQPAIPRTRPDTIDKYTNYFATIPQTSLVVRERQVPASADELFAWQRVAGANPMSLRRLTSLPEDFPFTEAHWQAAIGEGTFAAALGAGQVYGVDYTALHGAPATKYLGRQKYICGARAIFTAPAGRLRAVAIQLEPGGPVVTPADGTTWKMARYCLQVADANVHETREHLGRTHMVMEAVGIAARRQLFEEHPLRQLLEPHIAGTFTVNQSAKRSLIALNGVIDRVFAARIDVACSLVRASLDTFSLQDCAPARELKARGVDDPALEFPYREGVIPVYAAIERFVKGYVALYYLNDADVVSDAELQNWVAEVGSPIGGALKGIRKVETVAGLVEWMTNIIHLASTQHAAVNFPQFPFYAWGASVAGACWGPPPTGKDTEEDLRELMPPWDCLFLQADVVYLLSGVYYNKLGAYSEFQDPRVAPLVSAFQRELATIDETIAATDANRFFPYPYLRPSQITASVHI